MVEIFLSYSHKDEEMMNDVRRQLIVYERQKKIIKWYDRQIPLGSRWKDHIDERINSAQIIVLFMSPDFIESKYCYEIEGEIAMSRSESGDALVIPVILRPCAWEDSPFGELQALPKNRTPISRCDDRDVVTLEVAQAIMSCVDDLSKQGSRGNEGEVPRKSSSQLPVNTNESVTRTQRNVIKAGNGSVAAQSIHGNVTITNTFLSENEDANKVVDDVNLGSRTYVLNNTKQGGRADYSEWLTGYKLNGGEVFQHESHLRKENFRLVHNELSLKALYGSDSLELLVLSGGSIKFMDKTEGHSDIYYMEGFTTNKVPPLDL